MNYPLGKLLKNFAKMSRAEILVYLKNQEKELRSLHDRVAKPCCKYVLEAILE